MEVRRRFVKWAVPPAGAGPPRARPGVTACRTRPRPARRLTGLCDLEAALHGLGRRRGRAGRAVIAARQEIHVGRPSGRARRGRDLERRLGRALPAASFAWTSNVEVVPHAARTLSTTCSSPVPSWSRFETRRRAGHADVVGGAPAERGRAVPRDTRSGARPVWALGACVFGAPERCHHDDGLGGAIAGGVVRIHSERVVRAAGEACDDAGRPRGRGNARAAAVDAVPDGPHVVRRR